MKINIPDNPNLEENISKFVEDGPEKLVKNKPENADKTKKGKAKLALLQVPVNIWTEAKINATKQNVSLQEYYIMAIDYYNGQRK
mgnify:FL=1